MLIFKKKQTLAYYTSKTFQMTAHFDVHVRVMIKPLMPGGNKQVKSSALAAGLLKYVGPFCYHQALKFWKIVWLREMEGYCNGIAVHLTLNFGTYRILAKSICCNAIEFATSKFLILSSSHVLICSSIRHLLDTLPLKWLWFLIKIRKWFRDLVFNQYFLF